MPLSLCLDEPREPVPATDDRWACQPPIILEYAWQLFLELPIIGDDAFR